MYELKLKHHFDAAHHLELDYDSPCLSAHGHRWEVEVNISANTLNKNGMLADFKKIKEIINRLDHRDLNESLDFNPTAENIAKHLYDLIINLVGSSQCSVTIWESPEASITYSI